MSYRDYQTQCLLLPTVCTACFVESYAMALLSSDPFRAKSALRVYRSWLIEVSRGNSESTLEGTIGILRKTQLIDAKTVSEAAASPASSPCLGGTEKVSFSSGIYLLEKTCYDDSITTIVTPLPEPEVSKAVTEMLRKGLLRKEEEPVRVSVSPQLTNGRKQRYGAKGALGTTDACPGIAQTYACADNDNAARTGAVALSTRLESNGLRLMSFLALKHAAERAIAFIDRLQPSLKSEKQ